VATSGGGGEDLGGCVGCVLAGVILWFGLKVTLILVAFVLYLIVSPFVG
jgi:hypothetical protein